MPTKLVTFNNNYLAFVTIKKSNVNNRQVSWPKDLASTWLESQRDQTKRKVDIQFYHNCYFRILQRNFQACVESTQRSQEPSDRIRHNEADGSTPDTPDCRDLGYFVREMANSIQAYSFQMSKLSGTVVGYIFSQKYILYISLVEIEWIL